MRLKVADKLIDGVIPLRVFDETRKEWLDPNTIYDTEQFLDPQRAVFFQRAFDVGDLVEDVPFKFPDPTTREVPE